MSTMDDNIMTPFSAARSTMVAAPSSMFASSPMEHKTVNENGAENESSIRRMSERMDLHQNNSYFLSTGTSFSYSTTSGVGSNNAANNINEALEAEATAPRSTSWPAAMPAYESSCFYPGWPGYSAAPSHYYYPTASSSYNGQYHVGSSYHEATHKAAGDDGWATNQAAGYYGWATNQATVYDGWDTNQAVAGYYGWQPSFCTWNYGPTLEEADYNNSHPAKEATAQSSSSLWASPPVHAADAYSKSPPYSSYSANYLSATEADHGANNGLIADPSTFYTDAAFYGWPSWAMPYSPPGREASNAAFFNQGLQIEQGTTHFGNSLYEAVPTGEDDPAYNDWFSYGIPSSSSPCAATTNRSTYTGGRPTEGTMYSSSSIHEVALNNDVPSYLTLPQTIPSSLAANGFAYEDLSAEAGYSSSSFPPATHSHEQAVSYGWAPYWTASSFPSSTTAGNTMGYTGLPVDATTYWSRSSYPVREANPYNGWPVDLALSDSSSSASSSNATSYSGFPAHWTETLPEKAQLTDATILLLNLAEDVLKESLQFLDPKDLSCIGTCCKYLRELSIEEWEQRDAETSSACRSKAPTARERVVRFFKAQKHAISMRNDVLFEESPGAEVFEAPEQYEFFVRFSHWDTLVWQGFIPLMQPGFLSSADEIRLDIDQIYPLMDWSYMECLFDCYEHHGYRHETSQQMTRDIFENLDLAVVALKKTSEDVKPCLVIHTSGYSGAASQDPGSIRYQLRSQESESYRIDCSFCTNLPASAAIQRLGARVQNFTISRRRVFRYVFPILRHGVELVRPIGAIERLRAQLRALVEEHEQWLEQRMPRHGRNADDNDNVQQQERRRRRRGQRGRRRQEERLGNQRLYPQHQGRNSFRRQRYGSSRRF